MLNEELTPVARWRFHSGDRVPRGKRLSRL